MHGVGDCREANYCSGHGECVDGRCVCGTGWNGVNCTQELLCQYWDEANGIWSSEGLVASPPPSGVPDGFLHCDSTHLTDFGGVIKIPLSAEELLAELTAIKFNVFTLDDMANVLGEFDIAGNPAIFTMLFTCTGLDVLLILITRWRFYRRRVNTARKRIARHQEERDPEFKAKKAARELQASQEHMRFHARALVIAKQRNVPLKRLKEDVRLEVAAIALQSGVRGKLKRVDRTKTKAAIKLQSMVRGNMARTAAGNHSFANLAYNLHLSSPEHVRRQMQWRGEGSEQMQFGVQKAAASSGLPTIKENVIDLSKARQGR